MLKHSRISRSMDVGRLAASMSRPGIDPRVWVTLAVALDESQVDKDNGVFVDVKLIPNGEEYTARVPAEYAGAGFGIYSKIHKDDELLIIVPHGDPMEGICVVGRGWTAIDVPPDDVVNNPDDFILVVEKDKNLRLKVSGSGSLFIDTEDGAVNITTQGGAVNVTTNDGAVNVTAGNADVTVQSDTKTTVTCPEVEIGKDNDSKVTMLDGSKSAALAENLQNLYEMAAGIKQAFDNHVHGTGVGPSGPPTPFAVFPPWDPAINSTKIKLPNG